MPPLIALALVAGAAVLAAVAWTANQPVQPARRGLLAKVRAIAADVPAAPPVAESPEERAKNAQAAMAEWKTAILVRDPDSVRRIDAAFLEAPDTYLDGLRNSASSDDNERVRAFSTRELGKFKRADLIPLFEQLLADHSPYVRKNAAWALGELSERGDARAAARQAQPKLRHLASADPSDDVRAAARIALDQLR